MVVEKLLYNGQEGWYITQILQSSHYGIVEGLYKSESFGRVRGKPFVGAPVPIKIE
jgi:hypothetical protein